MVQVRYAGGGAPPPPKETFFFFLTLTLQKKGPLTMYPLLSDLGRPGVVLSQLVRDSGIQATAFYPICIHDMCGTHVPWRPKMDSHAQEVFAS